MLNRSLLAGLVAGLVVASAAFSQEKAQEKAPEMRLLRFPAIHGDTVVFTYSSDLWVADRKGGYARRLTTHRGEERRSRISPDGKLVAFSASYDGNADIYVMPLAGGAPQRITFDPFMESLVGWTPDGKVAYGSPAGSFTPSQPRLWVAEPTGGLPRALPIHEITNGSFFPDGRRIAYNRTESYLRWRRYRGGLIGKVSIYDLASNTYSELPGGNENSWFPMVAGNAIYYVSDRTGDTVNLYRHDLATKQDTQLTRYTDADIKWPSSDGKTIVYEHDGYLHAFDTATGKDERLTFQVRSDELAARPYMLKAGKTISDLSPSPSGKRIAVEARGEILDVAAKGGDARNLTNTPGVRERWPRWSPDGKTIAYLSDATGEYQIHGQPAAGGEAKPLSRHTGAGIYGFFWSPDSRRIVYVTQDSRFVLLEAETGRTTEIFRAEYQEGADFDWSPDGRWIAFSNTVANGFGAIHLYEVETGKTTRVTDGFYDDRNVNFDLSGKYLYFTSARTFTPSFGRFEASLKVDDADRIYVMPLARDQRNPLFPKAEEEGVQEEEKAESKGEQEKKEEKEEKTDTVRVCVDLEGLAGRAVVLPIPAGDPGALFGGKEAVFHYSEGKLRKFDLASRETTTIYDGPEIDLEFTPDRSKLAYFGKEVLGVADVKPDTKHGAGKVDTAAVEVWVDPRAEWRQMYWEAWRFERDNFFREDMWGLDWPAVGKHYEQFLPYVTHGSDLKYVLSLLLAELGTSHAYINDPPADPGANQPAASAAMLGADYELDGRWVRFRQIYPGTLTQDAWRGPLGEPGVNIKTGDYLLAIDGRPVDAGTHPNSLLINKADRVVTLTVNDKPSFEGARKVEVRPIAQELDLRYYEWVEENRRKVHEMSGGRIGYIHYPNTGTAGQTEFIRGYWAQTDKEAIILDERFNGGGFPQPMVLPTLGRREQTIVISRKWRHGSEIRAINGPKAMLINGYAGSGGDLTPWMFRDAGMGTLIGTRTFGGLVGIADAVDLVDGTRVTAPGYTRFDPETGEWIAENKGIAPDIEVDNRPDLLAQGRDPQLETAVQHLLKELEEKPIKVVEPKLPPPVKRGQS